MLSMWSLGPKEDVCGFAWAFATADRAHAATREGTFRALQSYAERPADRAVRS